MLQPAYLVPKHTLIHCVRAHAQSILQGEMHCKGRKPLPQSPYTLFLDDCLSTMVYAYAYTGTGRKCEDVNSRPPSKFSCVAMHYPTFILANVI